MYMYMYMYMIPNWKLVTSVLILCAWIRPLVSHQGLSQNSIWGVITILPLFSAYQEMGYVNSLK